jgi:hypothetical protein
MKISFITIFLIHSFLSFSQNEGLDAVINWKFIDKVKIYDNPKGNFIEAIQNDTISENFILLKIIEVKKDFFRVQIGLKMSDEQLNGWIKSADYVGAYHKNERFPMDLLLYSNPNLEEENKILLKNWNPGFITILDFKKEWVLIVVNYEGVRKKGWIHRDSLCANSYSTCS